VTLVENARSVAREMHMRKIAPYVKLEEKAADMFFLLM
jgi:hypothetical protein